MQRTVKVFVIAPGRSPGGPPEPAREIVVEAGSIDALLAAARTKLESEGFRVRAMSFGPDGLVTYVEQRS